MTTGVVELYEALRKAGINETLAREAASAVLATNALDEVAMKCELSELRLGIRADLAEFKADMIKWNVGTMALLTAMCAAIARLT